LASEKSEITLLEASTPPICTSCHRPVNPKEHGASFMCPNCGQVVIYRCRKCRQLSIPYTCPNCGFKGP